MAHKIPALYRMAKFHSHTIAGRSRGHGYQSSGLNAFMDGDKIELEVEKLGRLHFNVQDDLKRTWARDTRLQHKEKGLEGAHTPQLTGKYA